MWQWIRSAAVTLVGTLTATAAVAAGPCGPRADIADNLKREFNEAAVGHGLSMRGYVLELFVSAEGTWTLIVSRPGGLSCLVDGGEGWETSPPQSSSHETKQVLPAE